MAATVVSRPAGFPEANYRQSANGIPLNSSPNEEHAPGLQPLFHVCYRKGILVKLVNLDRRLIFNNMTVSRLVLRAQEVKIMTDRRPHARGQRRNVNEANVDLVFESPDVARLASEELRLAAIPRAHSAACSTCPAAGSTNSTEEWPTAVSQHSTGPFAYTREELLALCPTDTRVKPSVVNWFHECEGNPRDRIVQINTRAKRCRELMSCSALSSLGLVPQGPLVKLTENDEAVEKVEHGTGRQMVAMHGIPAGVTKEEIMQVLGQYAQIHDVLLFADPIDPTMKRATVIVFHQNADRLYALQEPITLGGLVITIDPPGLSLPDVIPDANNLSRSLDQNILDSLTDIHQAAPFKTNFEPGSLGGLGRGVFLAEQPPYLSVSPTAVSSVLRSELQFSNNITDAPVFLGLGRGRGRGLPVQPDEGGRKISIGRGAAANLPQAAALPEEQFYLEQDATSRLSLSAEAPEFVPSADRHQSLSLSKEDFADFENVPLPRYHDSGLCEQPDDATANNIKDVSPGHSDEEEDAGGLADWPTFAEVKESDNWFYLDPSGNEHGPFTSPEMLRWYQMGFFPSDLRLRRAKDTLHFKLDQYMTLHDGRLPFKTASQY